MDRRCHRPRPGPPRDRFEPPTRCLTGKTRSRNGARISSGDGPPRPPVITGIQPTRNLASEQADPGRVRGREWTGRVESWAVSAWPHTASSARFGSGGAGMRSHCSWGQDRHWYFVQRTYPPRPRPFTWRGTGNSYVHTPCSPRLKPPHLHGHFNPANLLRSHRPTLQTAPRI